MSFCHNYYIIAMHKKTPDLRSLKEARLLSQPCERVKEANNLNNDKIHVVIGV